MDNYLNFHLVVYHDNENIDWLMNQNLFKYTILKKTDNPTINMAFLNNLKKMIKMIIYILVMNMMCLLKILIFIAFLQLFHIV